MRTNHVPLRLLGVVLVVVASTPYAWADTAPAEYVSWTLSLSTDQSGTSFVVLPSGMLAMYQPSMPNQAAISDGVETANLTLELGEIPENPGPVSFEATLADADGQVIATFQGTINLGVDVYGDEFAAVVIDSVVVVDPELAATFYPDDDLGGGGFTATYNPDNVFGGGEPLAATYHPETFGERGLYLADAEALFPEDEPRVEEAGLLLIFAIGWLAGDVLTGVIFLYTMDSAYDCTNWWKRFWNGCRY